MYMYMEVLDREPDGQIKTNKYKWIYRDNKYKTSEEVLDGQITKI